MLCTGFAYIDAGVDKAGSGNETLAFTDAGTVRYTLVQGVFAASKDMSVFADDDRAGFVKIARRIEDADIFENG
ncbi:hypothetical protein D3C73_655210 [compost metagenome]